MNVFQIAGTTTSIVKYIEGGGFESDLASLEIQAATDALKKSKTASDSRSQIWSVINHLETAEAALNKTVRKNRQLQTAIRGYSRSADISELFRVRLLMASCYVYLREYALARRLLNRAEDCYALISDDAVVGGIIHSITGLVLINAFLDNREIYYDRDIEEKLKPAVAALKRTMKSSEGSD